ncbi:MAG TPA: hypothetical protein VI756_06150 [Blastocatellia bacterium]
MEQMKAIIGQVSNPATLYIRRARKLLADLDVGSPELAQHVWDAAFPMALMELSRWVPLIKKTTNTISAGDATMAFPSDFMSLDTQSFDDAKERTNPDFTYESALFSFDTTIAAATGVPNYLGAVAKPFADGTRFDIVDDGQGNKLMAFIPVAESNAVLTYLYAAYHQVADEVLDPEMWSVNPGSASSFTLSFLAQTTGSLTVQGLTAAGVQGALAALSTLGAGNVTVMETNGVFTVTLAGSLAGLQNPPAASALSASGTGGTVTVIQVNAGGAPTAAINTIPFDGQDVFVLALCQQACLVQAVNLAGDDRLSARFEKLADKFEGRFNERIRYTPLGISK